MPFKSSSDFVATTSLKVCKAFKRVVASRFVRRCNCWESSPSRSDGMMAVGAELAGTSLDCAPTWEIYLAPNAKPPLPLVGVLPENLHQEHARWSKIIQIKIHGALYQIFSKMYSSYPPNPLWGLVSPLLANNSAALELVAAAFLSPFPIAIAPPTLPWNTSLC